MRFIEIDLDSIVKRAIDEGGSLHWIYDVKPKYKNSSIANGGVLLFYCIEDKIYELNRHKLLMGLMQVLPYIQGDISNIDSETSDLIIQLGLWNELVYD